ncbi:hypothetical protein QF042_002577 [Pedobacter sp. W3I1]|uniref:hypothetical protein n=1 Tax=Pedobacter sp. W3I1 TaxID=3042291 RepID=UPI0027866F17|nr:hypothetical protein [Pedobacter sp. W3I1]MDQ0639012.1 hypothetical protein [Pedobacter sp. W3I1]
MNTNPEGLNQAEENTQYLIKRSAAVFLMRVGLCKRPIAGLTERFGYFGAPKYHATAA